MGREAAFIHIIHVVQVRFLYRVGHLSILCVFTGDHKRLQNGNLNPFSSHFVIRIKKMVVDNIYLWLLQAFCPKE